MVYSERLSHLPSWFVQLHDESLGKVDRQGQRVGTTAVPALGPKDQHAQVQLFREGPLDKLLALVIPEAPSRTWRSRRWRASGPPPTSSARPSSSS